MNKSPNIFDFATSELSQDAFLCWLAQWADPKYMSVNYGLHSLGKQFLSTCFLKHGQVLPDPLSSVQVRKQVDNLDVLIIVNDFHAIMIEDKIHTREHTNQLKRYKDTFKAKGIYNLYPIYYKTINQSNVDNVLAAGYQVFTRQDMLEILETGIKVGITDSIFKAYYEHLSNIDSSIQSYLTKPAGDWNYYSWVGFYSDLQERLTPWSEWDYVANPRGGFMGLWWPLMEMTTASNIYN